MRVEKEDRIIIGYIFCTWYMINGEKQFARDYGFKAWRIPVYAK
jgi:hypothetical protein